MDNSEITNIEKIVDIFTEEYKKTLEGLASGEPINKEEFFQSNS